MNLSSYESTRVLSVTSINQLFIGLACMGKNAVDSKKYTDYLIVSSNWLTDHAVQEIYCAAGAYGFEAILDLRSELSTGDWSRIGRVKSAIRLRTQFRAIIKQKSPVEVYLRYKLNWPERLILSEFKACQIHLFEDGLGDYLAGLHRLTKEQSAMKMLLGVLENGFQRILGVRSARQYLKHVSFVYELVKFRTGDRKQEIEQSTGATYLGIGSEYVNIIKACSREHELEKIPSNSVLFLTPLLSKATNKEYPAILDYSKLIIEGIRAIYPETHVLVKAHPRSPAGLVAMYQRYLAGCSCSFLDGKGLPAEAYLASDNLIAVVAASYSSTLIYAVQLFDTSAYYCSVPESLNLFFGDSIYVDKLSNNPFEPVVAALTQLGACRLDLPSGESKY